jgi:hypothetical protein
MSAAAPIVEDTLDARQGYGSDDEVTYDRMRTAGQRVQILLDRQRDISAARCVLNVLRPGTFALTLRGSGLEPTRPTSHVSAPSVPTYAIGHLRKVQATELDDLAGRSSVLFDAELKDGAA